MVMKIFFFEKKKYRERELGLLTLTKQYLSVNKKKLDTHVVLEMFLIL